MDRKKRGKQELCTQVIEQSPFKMKEKRGVRLGLQNQPQSILMRVQQ